MKQSKEKQREINDAVKARLDEIKYKPPPPWRRTEPKKRVKAPLIIAYDFETDRIAANATPRPRYLTAYAPGVIHLATAVDTMPALCELIEREFLTERLYGAKFVAWNGNRFDAFFVAAALVLNPRFRIAPYLTRGKTLRGLRITVAGDDDTKAHFWEFLDGMAMLGLPGMPLSKFLANFAPEHQKMAGAVDFDNEEFDSENPNHREYAMRDSVGLWHGMNRAQQIMLDTFRQPLRATIGAACIRIFQEHIPPDVEIEAPIPDAQEIIRRFLLRGGYCYSVRPYHGPIWKYDINQAYAAAMREADLPAGGMMRYSGKPGPEDRVFMVKIRAVNKRNQIPFYYRTLINGRVKAEFSKTEIAETWITDIEYRQLLSEGWRIECDEHYCFSDDFRMTDFVNKLENLRTTCEGGPSGPIGTMIKAAGNNAYGKTVEKTAPLQFIIAGTRPDDFYDWYDDGGTPISHIFYRIDETQKPKSYHQPQVGAWITAHVRMVLRRAALIDPDAWIYADTDCVVFTRDVTDRLDIDSRRYGAWKIEESGAVFRMIAKKVYSSDDATKRSAKGLNVRRLTADDFARWYEGNEPTQDQIQLNNFLQVLTGANMYRAQTRAGTRINRSVEND